MAPGEGGGYFPPIRILRPIQPEQILLLLPHLHPIGDALRNLGVLGQYYVQIGDVEVDNHVLLVLPASVEIGHWIDDDYDPANDDPLLPKLHDEIGQGINDAERNDDALGPSLQD